MFGVVGTEGAVHGAAGPHGGDHRAQTEHGGAGGPDRGDRPRAGPGAGCAHGPPQTGRTVRVPRLQTTPRLPRTSAHVPGRPRARQCQELYAGP